jgi:phage repressor protein C with HTH and peptisase S24 domain
MSTQNNEGEGNRTAAKQYNDAQKTFAESGKVDAAAQDAAKAVDGREGSEPHKAEEAGKRHAHGEDPQLKK